MSELLTLVAQDAIKSRLARARAGLERLSSAAPPIDFELIALATYSVATTLDLPAVTHAAHNLASVSRADALRNLTLLLGTDLVGKEVSSLPDLIWAARQIETAIQRAPTLPRPQPSTLTH